MLLRLSQPLQGLILNSSDRGGIRIQYSKNPFGKKRDFDSSFANNTPVGSYAPPAYDPAGYAVAPGAQAGFGAPAYGAGAPGVPGVDVKVEAAGGLGAWCRTHQCKVKFAGCLMATHLMLSADKMKVQACTLRTACRQWGCGSAWGAWHVGRPIARCDRAPDCICSVLGAVRCSTHTLTCHMLMQALCTSCITAPAIARHAALMHCAWPCKGDPLVRHSRTQHALDAHGMSLSGGIL